MSRYNQSREQLPDGSPSGLPLSTEVIAAAEDQALTAGDNALASIWQWALRIGADQDVVTALLRGIARGEPIDSVGDSGTRAELLDLFCERDLITQDAEGGFAFLFPCWPAGSRPGAGCRASDCAQECFRELCMNR